MIISVWLLYRCRLWEDPPEYSPRVASEDVYQCTWFYPPEVSLSVSDPVHSPPWREDDWCDDHADEWGHGRRRYSQNSRNIHRWIWNLRQPFREIRPSILTDTHTSTQRTRAWRDYRASTGYYASNLLQEDREGRWTHWLVEKCNGNIPYVASIHSLARDLYDVWWETFIARERFFFPSSWVCERSSHTEAWTLPSSEWRTNRDSVETRKWHHLSHLWRMNLDTRTSKARMKKISVDSRFCEWESEVYMSNFIKYG